MIKKMVLLSFLAINTCSATQLMSYQETVDALNDGKSIKFVVDWDLCKINVPDVKPNFSSSYSPDNVNIDKNGFIQSWGMRYTHKIGALPQVGSVYQAYVYTFTKNNELHAVDYFLDPVTYKEKMPRLEATCQLGTGFKVFA